MAPRAQRCRAAAPLLLAVLAAALSSMAAGARGLAQAGAAAPAASPTVVPAAGAVSEEDEALLLAFKDSLDNGGELLASWQPGTDVCAWTGVSCGPTGVESLVLIDKGLRGTIPWPDGWKLPATITDISLGNTKEPPQNQLRGPLPPNWQLPPRLTLLFLGYNPIGGTLPPSLQMPDTLQFLLMENVNVSGPLPPWPLPAVQSINLIANQLTGGIPEEWTRLNSLAVMSLQDNRLSGTLPATMTFNQSFQLNALSVNGNNFSGRVPSWPDQPIAQIGIRPGNEGLCGEVPAFPGLLEAAGQNSIPVTSLPPCPGDPTSDDGGLSGSAVAGIVVGCVAGGALALVGATWLVRRRRQAMAVKQGSKGDGGLSSSSTMSWMTSPSSILPSTNTSAKTQLPVAPFNPFAGGPKSLSNATTPLGSWEASAQGSGGSRSVPLTALRSSDGGSGATPVQQAALLTKLEALAESNPAWLISPARLTLEQGSDGRLVLLGSGAYGRVYRGWLQPEAATAAAVGPAAGGSSAEALGRAILGESGAPRPLPVAVKVMEAADLGAFLREADLMTRLAGSPHVVALHGACVADQQLIVVMELMEGGDLRALLSGDAPPNWASGCRQLALDIAEGLVFLHSCNVTHRDLKSKNVLLTSDGRAKISDVGTAALHSATYLSVGSSKFGGTLAWAAPELLLGAPISHQSDIYSMGVVLWELATKHVPRRGDVVPPPPSDACPAGLSDLIRDCLELEPARRPTAQQVLERLRAL